MKLRRLRELKNLTQVDLATIIGTTPNSISEWETYLHVPQYKSIEKLQSFFGKDIITKQDFILEKNISK